MKEIIINNGIELQTVAVLENGKLTELYENKIGTSALDGNIYCGRVKDVLLGIQSAFIDIGEEKNAFINIKDVIPKMSDETGNKQELFEQYNIKDYIKVNMPILVQVKKDEEDQKGAKVSKHMSLTGRYVVLMPNVSFVAISQKINNENERIRLKELGKEILQDINNDKQKYGLILRTTSENVSKDIIQKETNKLIEEWNHILIKYDECKKQGMITKIYQRENIAIRIITSTLDSEICKVIVNDQKVYTELETTIEELKKSNVKLEMFKGDLINNLGLQDQIDKSKQRKIWLNCGGFITIDETEALTAIDVNSGKYTGKKYDTKENTTYKVNKEATIEIARQLQLRNIGGIIVIDYIDMEKDEERNEIISIFKNELKKDRSKTEICDFTKLDLLEMTRKKI